jgi:hypothetical protein
LETCGGRCSKLRHGPGELRSRGSRPLAPLDHSTLPHYFSPLPLDPSFGPRSVTAPPRSEWRATLCQGAARASKYRASWRRGPLRQKLCSGLLEPTGPWGQESQFTLAPTGSHPSGGLTCSPHQWFELLLLGVDVDHGAEARLSLSSDLCCLCFASLPRRVPPLPPPLLQVPLSWPCPSLPPRLSVIAAVCHPLVDLRVSPPRHWLLRSRLLPPCCCCRPSSSLPCLHLIPVTSGLSLRPLKGPVVEVVVRRALSFFRFPLYVPTPVVTLCISLPPRHSVGHLR